MTDNEIIKALECCINEDGTKCNECPYDRYCEMLGNKMLNDTLDLINRQKAEIERLEYALTGVMHSVDKWLEGGELNQNEVKRAIRMREKTLQIVERLQAENKEQDQAIINALKRMGEIRAEAVKEFAEIIKTKMPTINFLWGKDLDNLVKEFAEGNTDE